MRFKCVQNRAEKWPRYDGLLGCAWRTVSYALSCSMSEKIDIYMTLQGQVKSGDYERWLTVHYAPAKCRAALIALLAFNLDLSRIMDTAREPMLAELKLAWWRDRLSELWDGAEAPAHPVLQAFAEQGITTTVPVALLHEMIEARVTELYRNEGHTPETLEAYAIATGGALAEAMAYCLIGKSDKQARQAGTYYALVFMASQGKNSRVLQSMFLKPRQNTLAVDLQAVLARDYFNRGNLSSGKLVRQMKMLWSSLKV